MIKGMDVSTLAEVERCGGKFRLGGREGDALQILRDCGANLIRLRIWNDPKAEDGAPYGGGGNDLETTLQIAARAKALGLDWMATFHYSDFWSDPGKQRMPKTWRGMDAEAMAGAVYDFTKSALLEMKRRDLMPACVCIGNEITNGLLWPLGQVPNYRNIAAFVSAGLRAAREVSPFTKTMLHLDAGGNNPLYRAWFEGYFAAGGADFDLIGLSYYPFWHGPLSDLKDNLNDLAARFGRDMVIVETAMGFTQKSYARYEGLSDGRRKGPCAKPELAVRVPYSMTPKGQADFLRDLAAVIRQVPGGKCLGFVYWEPAWLPVPGSGWATEPALEYIQEQGPGGNEWANLCLFDYEGHALPALEKLREL